MPTLREYLNEKLGTVEERLAKMTPKEREAFERTARIRAAVRIAENHEEHGRCNCANQGDT